MQLEIDSYRFYYCRGTFKRRYHSKIPQRQNNSYMCISPYVIYRGTCTCNQVYIGETARNLEVRVNEHSDINKQSEPAKHLKKHPEHKFIWDILTSAHSWTKRKIKEAFYIARFNPDLNKQVQSFHLTLYPMGTGIT